MMLAMSVDHYENFPVASILMPARLRPAIHAIYRFSRQADDIADEGEADAQTRLIQLTRYEHALDTINDGQLNFLPDLHPTFSPLADVCRDYQLPLTPFYRLLSAFKQDVVKQRYETYEELLDYCQRSADPVGELMLHLYQAATARALSQSSAICTALQLTNFWQDIAIDWKKNRVYIPQDDLAKFQITEEDIKQEQLTDQWQALMQFQVSQTRQLFLKGAPLALELPGRIGWELRLIVLGGLRILDKIEAVHYDVFRFRPTLTKRDYVTMLWNAVNYRSYCARLSTSL